MARQAPRWDFNEAPAQALTVAFVLIPTVLTIGPRDSPSVIVLLAVNSLLLATRLIPVRQVPLRVQFAILAAGTISAVALVAVASDGFSPIFAMFIAGQAGFRLASRPALLVAGGISVACTAVLLLPIGPGKGYLPWYIGAVTGVPVLIGMMNRSRSEALHAAEEAAQQADRAAQSEAREQILAERGRIARDVHDLLAHSLAGINMQLEMADALLDAGQVDRARVATQRAQAIVRDGMAETQRTVLALRGTTLPLAETLRTMTDNAAADFDVAGEPGPLTADAVQAMVRAAQESLTNAHKYAPGAAIRVTLDYRTDATRLEVVNAPISDTKRPLAHAGSGMGLVGMRERVTAMGGTAVAGPILDGADRGGWRVRVSVPTGR